MPRLQDDPNVKKVVEAFAKAMNDVFDVDIKKQGLIGRNFYSSVARFVKVYGLENSLLIIDEAYYGKYNGRWNGGIISENLFLDSFDWMSRSILMEGLAGGGSWK